MKVVIDFSCDFKGVMPLRVVPCDSVFIGSPKDFENHAYILDFRWEEPQDELWGAN